MKHVLNGNIAPESDVFYPQVNSNRTGPLSVDEYEC